MDKSIRSHAMGKKDFPHENHGDADKKRALDVGWP
jgi:hypothetical protein